MTDSKNLPVLHLSAQSFGVPITLAQRLQIEPLAKVRQLMTAGGEKSFIMEALLEVDDESVSLAGFALGQRVFSLQWAHGVLSEWRAMRLPGQVNAEKILRDVQLVYWPTGVINAALPKGWQLFEAGNHRELRFQQKVIVLVDYADAVRWKGAAVLENHQDGYRLLIESIEQ